ncbi:hypothetical protein NMY22_g6617 [Coprinellus aureogranulatus]|nr:hypothetical protein NMY22_g6617 [Coprinellus aureogranulatus]
MDLETLAKLQAIVKGYRATMYVNYVGVATHALVFADFLHTFPDEVRLMWRTPLTIPTALYFTLRYYILAHQALAILYGLPRGLPPEECKARFSRVALSSLVIATMSEAILFLRVYAFSGKSKKALVLLIFQYLAIFGPAFVLDSKFRRSVRFVNLGIPNLVCMPVESNNVWLGAICALLLGSIMGKSVRSLPVFSTKLTQPHFLPAVMCIMMYIAFKKHRHFSSPLLSVFYSDGVFYFISLSVLASGNIIVNLAAPEGGFKFLFIQPQNTIHGVLAARMLLHLRKQAEHDRLHGRRACTGTMASALEYSTSTHMRYNAGIPSDSELNLMPSQRGDLVIPLQSFRTTGCRGGE